MIDRNYLETLANGEEKMNYLQKCIAEADNEKNFEDMLWLRHDYIHESVFHDDGFKALLMFPEFMKLFDENPDIVDPRTFMFVFKWIMQQTSQHYQISLEDIEKYFDRFKAYIKRFGYTMRTYYRMRFEVYEDIETDPEVLLGYMEESEKYERTNMSDCEACEMSNRIRCQMKFGSEEKAIKLMHTMLDKGMRCAEVPNCTFAAMAHQFAIRGVYDEARHYAELALPLIEDDFINYMPEVSGIIELYTIININEAYELFRKTAHLYSQVRNPLYRFNYANAAARFFAALCEAGEEELHTNLNADFEYYNDSGEYKTAEMRDTFYAVAKDLADKFNERNGNDNFTKLLEFVYPEGPTVEFDLPLHGKVAAQPFALAVPYKSPENFPGPDKLKEILESLGEFESTGMGIDKENGIIFAGGRDEDGNSSDYRILFNDIADPADFEQVHYLPQGAGEKLGEYSCMMIIVTEFSDCYADMRKLVKFANALNLDDSPVIFDLVNSRIFSTKWTQLEASCTSAPLEKYMYRIMIYRSAFEEGKADVATIGLEECGSRNILVPAVDEDDVPFVRAIVRQVANYAVGVSHLPDEGLKFNAGIIYDQKSFLKLTWEAISLPDEEDGRIFAKPMVYMPDNSICEIDEISEEDRDLLTLRSTNRASFIEEAKSRQTYDKAYGFFVRNADEFDMIAGVEVDITDENGEEDVGYLYVQLAPDGPAVVLSEDFDQPELQPGQFFEVDPSRLFFWRLDVGDQSFTVDDLYFLLTKETELENAPDEPDGSKEENVE